MLVLSHQPDGHNSGVTVGVAARSIGPLGWLGMAVRCHRLSLALSLRLHRIDQREAVVNTLDAHGIADTRKRSRFVHWQDVRRARLGIGSRSPQYLCLDLKPAAVLAIVVGLRSASSGAFFTSQRLGW